MDHAVGGRLRHGLFTLGTAVEIGGSNWTGLVWVIAPAVVVCGLAWIAQMPARGALAETVLEGSATRRPVRREQEPHRIVADLRRHEEHLPLGLPERLVELVPPESWELDWARHLPRPRGEAHWELFTDYRTHVARFGEIAHFHRAVQPLTLIVWGVHDPNYELESA